jgi:hypothetical protein
MYNREILEKIIDEIGVEKTSQFCHIVSLMYDIKYNACKTELPLSEYDYERQWWSEAGQELNKTLTIQ